METLQLYQLRNEWFRKKDEIPREALESFDKSFDIEFAHNSTAIEGNTLSLMETKAILEDNLSIGGKSLWEIYEVVNHNKAFTYIKKIIVDGNGRTSRLIMNYQLMSGGFLPVSIAKEQRLEYFNGLEEYAVNDNLGPFIDMISVLEIEKLKEYLTLCKLD